jgi:predicted nuclease with TOPRIM domain
MSRNKTAINIGIAVIIVLLLINAFLLWNKFQQDKKIAEQQSVNTELTMAKTELEKTYYEAMSELEALRTGNDSLNVLINQQQDELTNQRQRILKLSKSESDLRASIKDMRDQNDGFIAQINQLVAENEELSFALNKSEQQRKVVTEKYQSELERGNELSGEVEDLSAAKEQLERKEQQLASKVNAASVVMTNKVSINGIKVKGSGKQVDKANANKVDLFEVCFTTTKNYAAAPGSEEFFIRILNPEGETMAVESMGSGMTKNLANGEDMRYTMKTELDYNQDNQQKCVEWTPPTDVRTGRYEALIYNKGYLSGKGSTILK